MVESELRDFVLGGVGLEGEQKQHFNEIQQELAQLSMKFNNNVRACWDGGSGCRGVYGADKKS